jgi:hypothetical protein
MGGAEVNSLLHLCTPCTEGWEAKYSLKEGIARTYPWIEAQVRAAGL